MTERRTWLTTAALSPVRVQPQLCHLPYGLRWDDLAASLPGFTTPRGARSWVSYRKQGLNGGSTSRILTLGYPGPDGREQTLTIFLKQTTDPGKAEAAKYRFLEEQGVCLPHLLGSVTNASGEVIVLEFLPTVGVAPEDADEVLEVIARLNTVSEPPANLFTAPAGMPERDFDARVTDALTRLASIENGVDPARWFDTYKSTEVVVARQPVGLCHGELAFQQVGRTVAGRVVVFDLETVALRPRLTDVAAVLGNLAMLTGVGEHELFRRYRKAINRLVGTSSEPLRTWRELLAVRVVSSFQSLPWLMGTIGDRDVGFDPGACVRDLGADLAALER